MKWPFVRRSKYELLENGLNIVKEGYDRFLVETNRLNQELANELNSHRETKEMWQESLAHNDLFLNKIKDLEKELEEINQLRFDKSHLKQKVKKLESEITKCKSELELAKSHVNWFYGNYARFKDMIEKYGYYHGK